VWYTVTERYEAGPRAYHFTITERESGDLVLERTLASPQEHVINPELRRLGISMHPEGLAGSDMGSFSSRLNGSAEYLIDNVTLTQIYGDTFDQPSSILFLPGIQSSRLYIDTFVGTTDRVWEPNHNQDVQQLSMSESGVSVVDDIYTEDVIDEVHGFVPVYADFLEYLDSLRTNGTISDFETFAYDWRYNVADIVEDGTQYPDGVRLGAR
jgi:hypothetical protein